MYSYYVFLEYEVKISLEDKNRIVCDNIFKHTLMIKVENAPALGILCHLSPILVMYQELIAQICLSYYPTL